MNSKTILVFVLTIITTLFSFTKSGKAYFSETTIKNGSIQDSFLTNLKKDKLPTLKFLGNATAELYTREIEESFKGVLKLNFISTLTDGYPIGFLRASIPKNGWWETLWTRDGGTHLRELAHWGMLEHASAVVDCLTLLVEKNEE